MEHKPDLKSYPGRMVLPDVPRVTFYEGGERCPEDIPYPSCVRALMDYLGEKFVCQHNPAPNGAERLKCGCAFMLGVSGAAFGLTWGAGWQMDNSQIMYLSPPPQALLRHPWEAAGYGCEFISREDGRDNETLFRTQILESINRKRPVLAFGVIGPPECCIVTGYDEGGDVLTGWNFFQGMPEFNAGVQTEPCGYFRKRDWFAETTALLVVGSKHQAPPKETVFREALARGLEIMRTAAIWPDRSNGLTAFDAWEEAIGHDEPFATDGTAALRRLFDIHDEAVGTVAEARWYGNLFLEQAAAFLPDAAEHLTQASACFRAEHDLMWKIWGLVGGIGRSDEKARKLAEADVRRAITTIIRQSREKDAEAAEAIAQALG